MPLPTFIIIGAAKAGTTSLCRYLQQHPDVYMSPVKEPRFFAVESAPPGLGQPDKAAAWTGTITTFEAYQRLFDGVTTETAIGEASPLYLGWSERSATSIQRHLPTVKLIACLRQPVDRAFSHYLHSLRLGIENARTFEQAIGREDGRRFYLGQGYYFRHLTHYFQRFDSAQIKVYLYDDLLVDTRLVVQDICAFIGVDPQAAIDISARHNVSQPEIASGPIAATLTQAAFIRRAAKAVIPGFLKTPLARWVRQATTIRPQLDPATRLQLTNQFAEDIRQLQDLLQRDLSHWLKDRSGSGRPSQ